ncbi:MAG: hypothetical protein KBH14_07605 [Vicinamibacteria bacterium]|jgi:hypothetical protein|nr:hypothetical protein [Vicinamibacteria bacterium]
MSFLSLRALAVIGGVYDLALAVPMIFAPELTARLFGAPAPVPVVNAQLNGLFTLTLALGYFWAAQDVDARRGYLWIAGVFVKVAGAALFVGDHFLRGSPSTFLLFAATDGSIALLTLVALLSTRNTTRQT